MGDLDFVKLFKHMTGMDIVSEDSKIYIKRIIFNDPATVILWSDGSKTVVKRAVGDVYDPYAGFCAAVTKKVMGNNSRIKKVLKERSNYGEVKHGEDEV